MMHVASFLLGISLLAVPAQIEALSVSAFERRVAFYSSVVADGLALNVNADEIVFDEHGSFVEATVDSNGFGDIVNALTESVQDTTVGWEDGVLVASGSGSVGIAFDIRDPGFRSRVVSNALTAFSVDFAVEAPTAYSLAVALSSEIVQQDRFSGELPPQLIVISSASLHRIGGPSQFSVWAQDFGSPDGQPFERIASTEPGATLYPGVYRLKFETYVYGEGEEDVAAFGTAGFGFEFRIPEPGTATLFAFGLWFLALRRRR